LNCGVTQLGAELESSETGRKKVEETVKRARNEFEQLGEERTTELYETDESLQGETSERKRA